MKRSQEETHQPATVLFHESYFDYFYGAQTGLYNLLGHLDRNRFHPIVVCPGEGIFTERVRELGIEIAIVPLPEDLMTFGGSLLRAALVRKAWAFAQLLPQVRDLIRLIRRRHVRLMHCNTPRSVLSSGWAARLIGIPLIWHVKGDVSNGFLDTVALRLSTMMIAISDDVKHYVEERFPTARTKIVTVRDGIPLGQFQSSSSRVGVRDGLGFTDDHLVVGTVGALVPRKGFDVFIEMAKKVAAVDPKARFVIVGDINEERDRPYQQKLLDLGDPLIREGKLVFTGWRDDMANVYSAMDVFVLASSREGLALVVVEAMASGKPIVRTVSAGANDTVVHGETGFLVQIGDADEMAAAVKSLLADSVLRESMGAASRRRALSVFAAERMAREVECIFADCLAPRAGVRSLR